MKKLLLIFSLFVAIAAPALVVSGGQASAYDIFEHTCSSGGKISSTSVCSDVNQQAGSSENPVIRALKIALNTLSLIGGIIAVIMVIVSGLRYITSDGDATGAKNAKHTLMYSLIGIAIIVAAQTIVRFTLSRI
ncbi:MAG: rane protein of unknown function [Candidatus Saccharibacteria bacterium]|nr:rane protein of unknown function [Candidatus Saccharibacteria bacterium]